MYSIRSDLVRSTVLHRHPLGRMRHKVNFLIVACAGRSTAKWLNRSGGRHSDTFELTPTLTVNLRTWMFRHLTFVTSTFRKLTMWRSTLQNSRPSAVNLRSIDLPAVDATAGSQTKYMYRVDIDIYIVSILHWTIGMDTVTLYRLVK